MVRFGFLAGPRTVTVTVTVTVTEYLFSQHLLKEHEHPGVASLGKQGLGLVVHFPSLRIRC